MADVSCFFCIPGVFLPVILRRTLDLCFTSGTVLACVFEHKFPILFVSIHGFPWFFNHIYWLECVVAVRSVQCAHRVGINATGANLVR